MKRLLALTAAAAFSLVGCTVVDSERPSDSPSAAQSEAGADAEQGKDDSAQSEAEFVDVSPGGPKKDDPLWQALAKASDSGAPLYIWAWMQTSDEPGDGDTVTLSPTVEGSVKVTAPKDTVDANGSFALITGTFDVKANSDGDYSLDLKSPDSKDELVPDGPSTEERCTAPDAHDAIGGAADKLAQNPDARDELRREWLSSPEVWWAIQDAGRNLRESNGDFEGDSFAQACSDYVQGG